MNPFFNRQRITDARFFYGRRKEIEQICSALATRQCRALVGERKLGKSSLLTHIARPQTLQAYGLDAAQYLFIYLDLEALTSANPTDFWLEVLEILQTRLPSDELKAAVTAVLNGEIRFMSVRRLLRRIRASNFEIVLCLDEFEALARNARFEPDFYGELRSLASELGIIYLTASKRGLYELTYEHSDTLSSPFFNIFAELPLRLMADTEIGEMLMTLSSVEGKPPFIQEELDFIVNLAGPHPFFAQIAATHLYDSVPCGQPHPRDVYEGVRKRFLAEAEDHYRYIWNNLTAEEQTALIRVPKVSGDTERTLYNKALVRERQNQAFPFSDGFASFLIRQQTTQDISTGPTTTQTDDLNGKTLGTYRVLSLLGRGGMAKVYKGYHPLLDRYVAIKILLPDHAADTTFVERFQREATAIARLRHPNIVQIHDFGAQMQITYMVMEYIAGMTLKERLQQARLQERHLPQREILALLHGLANALDYAHTHGLVHRDVKPANVILREDQSTPVTDTKSFAAAFTPPPPVAILTDFGIAKILEGVQFTETGMSMGTPDYMSPEQAGGDEVTAQSDVYALGIVLFEMLTNRLPFAAETPIAVVLKHLHDEPPPLRTISPHLPPALEEALQCALAKEPRHRFATAGELWHAVNQAWPVTEPARGGQT